MNGRAHAILRHITSQIGAVETVDYRDTPWHSATFDGVRHCFAFTVDSVVDVATFAAALSEADIPLPGGFVADAIVTGIQGTRVSVEVLTIDAA